MHVRRLSSRPLRKQRASRSQLRVEQQLGTSSEQDRAADDKRRHVLSGRRGQQEDWMADGWAQYLLFRQRRYHVPRRADHRWEKAVVQSGGYARGVLGENGGRLVPARPEWQEQDRMAARQGLLVLSRSRIRTHENRMAAAGRQLVLPERLRCHGHRMGKSGRQGLLPASLFGHYGDGQTDNRWKSVYLRQLGRAGREHHPSMGEERRCLVPAQP